jgi:hypothetical protein
MRNAEPWPSLPEEFLGGGGRGVGVGFWTSGCTKTLVRFDTSDAVLVLDHETDVSIRAP